MRTFKINGTYVQAGNLEEAQQLWQKIEGCEADRFIVMRSQDGSITITPMSENGYLEVWSKSGNSVQYCGKVCGGTGQKILQAAIGNVNITEREAAKLSNAVRKVKRERRHTDDNKAIDDFESSVPPLAKALYTNVMNRIGATTLAYKLEIIDSLVENGVTVKEHNWIPILTWFRDKVLDEEENLSTERRRTFFQVRKAFATTVARMAKDDVRHASTMGLVAQEGKRDNDFWTRYAEDKGAS